MSTALSVFICYYCFGFRKKIKPKKKDFSIAFLSGDEFPHSFYSLKN